MSTNANDYYTKLSNDGKGGFEKGTPWADDPRTIPLLGYAREENPFGVKSVFDIGAGEGYSSRSMALKLRAQVLSIDPSESMIKQSYSQAITLNRSLAVSSDKGGVTSLVGTLGSMPLQSFDATACRFSLGYMLEPEESDIDQAHAEVFDQLESYAPLTAISHFEAKNPFYDKLMPMLQYFGSGIKHIYREGETERRLKASGAKILRSYSFRVTHRYGNRFDALEPEQATEAREYLKTNEDSFKRYSGIDLEEETMERDFRCVVARWPTNNVQKKGARYL